MRAYQDMVFSTAARLTGNDTQAEDIAQEVFIRAYEHFSDLRGSVTAGGWLKTVTTNLTLNYLSRYRKRWRLFSEMRPSSRGRRGRMVPELDWEVPDTRAGRLERRTTRSPSSTPRCASCPIISGCPWCCITSRTCPTKR